MFRRFINWVWPWAIKHRSSLELLDKELQHSKKVTNMALEDKNYWREAYFKPRANNNGSGRKSM